MTAINPDSLTSICYHENDTHSLDFAVHGNLFLGVSNTREELIEMMGFEDYYALAVFCDWETLKPIQLLGLSDEYLAGPPEA